MLKGRAKGSEPLDFLQRFRGSQGYQCVPGVNGFIGAEGTGDKQNLAGYPEHSQV